MTTLRPGLARPGLAQRQAPTLAMTPRMQQAVRLLQFTGQELAAYLGEAIESNPLLRLAGDGGERAALPAPLSTEGIGTDALLARPDARLTGTDRPLDTDYGNLYAGEGGGRGGASAGYDDDAYPGIDQTLADLPSLADHLSEQAALAFRDPRDRLAAEHLIGALDGAGWLTEAPEAIAGQLGLEPERMARVLEICRGFEPTGVFARDLADCLALQLAERNRLDPAMQRLLDNLPLVARREVAMLARLCGVDAEDVVDMIGEIRALDPKPGARFRDDPVPTRIPDVIVRAAPPPRPGEAARRHGEPPAEWIVELNEAVLPRLLIDRRYRMAVSHGAEARPYLRRCLEEARWLIRALDRRATTLLAVSGAIARRQDAFLRHGLSHLRPMVLRDIAADTGLHESTVSRVVAGKTIETPRGLFAMKALFTQGLAAGPRGSPDGGVVVSAEAVRLRIRALIEAEGGSAPLSDDRIAAILAAEGVAIARRTVAKYREAMGIPSSSQRRREAALAPVRAARG